MQRRQNRRVSYAKTYPSKTPSHLQAYRRARFRAANFAWHQWGKQNKATLDTIAERLGACMSGYNIFMSCYLSGNMRWLPEWAADMSLPWEEPANENN